MIAGTYYGVGLVGVLAKLLPSHILQNISVDMIKAISVPFVCDTDCIHSEARYT